MHATGARILLGSLILTTLAGCVSLERPAPGDQVGELEPRLRLADLASAGEPLWMIGTELVGPDMDHENAPPPFLPQPPRPTCGDHDCETLPLWIGDTDGHDVAIVVEWEGQDETWDTQDAPGAYLGAPAAMLDSVLLRDGVPFQDMVESFHYAGAIVLEDPEPGAYALETVSRYGTTPYLVSIRLQAPDALVRPDPDGDILPDLVAIAPDHPTFELPVGHEAGTPLAATVGGCGPDETGEDQDLRCLRFAGIIGNQGPGTFLTVLEYDQAAGSITGAGHWDQVIERADGSERTHPIGAADYHAMHGHFHILDLVATQLYSYDPDTQTRGEAVGDGRKMGFCIIDGGVVDTLGNVTPPRFNGTGCCYMAGMCQLDMLAGDRFEMGMSANWYDIYPWWRSDQYIEVSGLADGVYELVSVINPDQLILESDTNNNEASTVLRITGDQVEVLQQKTQAHLGPHPDADWGYAAQKEAAEG